MRLVETIDADGEIGPPIGILEAHRVGTPHRAISIIGWNPSRTKMLITRRALTKATWPGFWSNAVCSHPLPQEGYQAAATRRLREELNLEGDVTSAFNLFYGPVRCPVSGAFEHEFDHVFYVTLPEDKELRPNPDEIESARWADREELARLKDSGKLTPWFMMILDRVEWGR